MSRLIVDSRENHGKWGAALAPRVWCVRSPIAVFDRAAELRLRRAHVRALREELTALRETRRVLAGRIARCWTQLAALNTQAAASQQADLQTQHDQLEAQYRETKVHKQVCDAQIAQLTEEIKAVQTQIRAEEADLLRIGRRTR